MYGLSSTAIRIPSPPLKREGGAVRGYYNVEISFITCASQITRSESEYAPASSVSSEMNRRHASLTDIVNSLLYFESVQSVICKKACGRA